MKDESYDTFKYPRAIYSRTDEFKCLYGPFTSLVDKIIFKLRFFIKKIPTAERPKFMAKEFEDLYGLFDVIDFERYEAHHTRELMYAIQWVLYKHIFQNVEKFDFLEFCFKKVISNWNMCYFKWFAMIILATRMSGEMDTSVMNGFCTLMIILFLYFDKYKIDITDIIKMFLEGDDSIHKRLFDGLNNKDFLSLGITAKIETYECFSYASFCGLVADPYDFINTTDPISYLCDFFWMRRPYANSRSSKLTSLLRCKALSCLYQYPGCPILYSMAKSIIRLTEDFDIDDDSLFKFLGSYRYEEFIKNRTYASKNPEIFSFNTPDNTRLLCFNLYGIEIRHQIEIEQWFDQLTNLFVPIIDTFNIYLKPEHISYYSNYCCQVDSNNDNLILHHMPMNNIINNDRSSLYSFLNKQLVTNKDLKILYHKLNKTIAGLVGPAFEF